MGCNAWHYSQLALVIDDELLTEMCDDIVDISVGRMLGSETGCVLLWCEGIGYAAILFDSFKVFKVFQLPHHTHLHQVLPKLSNDYLCGTGSPQLAW